MDLIPCMEAYQSSFINLGPFSLGTSRADPGEIIPAQVSGGNLTRGQIVIELFWFTFCHLELQC